MNDLMLYIMVAAIFAMFGWAGFEYAKAGYQFWKEQRHAANGRERKSAKASELKGEHIDH